MYELELKNVNILYRAFYENGGKMNENIINTTVGLGGGTTLIIGKDKTALLDSGMAYCGGEQAQKVKEALSEKNRTLDYVIATHSHYDHVGGAGFLREEWPNLILCGAEHAKKVLAKASAMKLIRSLSLDAQKLFGTEKDVENNKLYGEEAAEHFFIDEEHLKIDLVLNDGDVLDLGETKIEIMLTPGHTKCSLSFFLPKEEIIFPSESTGVLIDKTDIKPSILVSFKDAMESWEKCSKISAKRIISSHAQEVSPEHIKDFWGWSRKTAELSRDVILDCYNKGQGRKEMLEAYRREFRKGFLITQQPIEAFDINANASIDVILREFTEQ